MMTKKNNKTYWVCRYCKVQIITTVRMMVKLKCSCGKFMYYSNTSFLGAMLKWQKKPKIK